MEKKKIYLNPLIFLVGCENFGQGFFVFAGKRRWALLVFTFFLKEKQLCSCSFGKFNFFKWNLWVFLEGFGIEDREDSRAHSYKILITELMYIGSIYKECPGLKKEWQSLNRYACIRKISQEDITKTRLPESSFFNPSWSEFHVKN